MSTAISSTPPVESDVISPFDAQTAIRLRIVIVGHVDHGKSTLIGRLFHDTHSLPDGKIEAIRKASEAEGMEFEYAFLLDALLEEQEQNITIDTTQLPFRTEKRPYVIIDAPGHKEFLKNMITGAASADAAILLIDAQEGIQEQSMRHAYLLSLLGIGQVVVAVNKMDLVDYEESAFERIRTEYNTFLRKLGVTPAFFIPISAKRGHHIVGPSDEMPWYRGPSILSALDEFDVPAPPTDKPLRLVLQDVYRFDERRILAGRIETGSLRVGDEIVFRPDRKRSRIRSIEHWPERGERPQSASAGESVAITLDEQIFVERGQIGSHPENGPAEGRELHASLFWLHADPLLLNAPVTLKLATQEMETRLVHIERLMDSSTLEPIDTARTQVQKNEVADVRLRVRRPIAFDQHDRINETGRFVLVLNDRIAGGGIIREANYESRASRGVESDNLTWTTGKVTREARADMLGHRGAVIWLTGLSGSGKSTLAIALEAQLYRRGMMSFVIDGDNLRHGLCSDLGFSPEERAENIRRAGELARLMAEAGVVTICSLISPFREDRNRVREICQRDGLAFAEIWLSTPIDVCEGRDPRGLYKKARAGEISNFTGINSPYEPPEHPEIIVPTHELSPEESLDLVLERVLQLSRHPQDRTKQAVESGSGI